MGEVAGGGFGQKKKELGLLISLNSWQGEAAYSEGIRLICDLVDESDGKEDDT